MAWWRGWPLPFQSSIVVPEELPEMPAEICVRLQCTVAISHHHSKGAQGVKSSIDRGSGSGVFGRAPNAVADETKLVLEPGTIEMARQVNRLAEQRRLTGWHMSFMLREFPPREPLDIWLTFPLHDVDDTGLLAVCKPNYGGVSEARRARPRSGASATPCGSATAAYAASTGCAPGASGEDDGILLARRQPLVEPAMAGKIVADGPGNDL